MNGTALANGDTIALAPPAQLAFAIPTSPDTKLHLHLTNLTNSLLLFLSTSTNAAPSTTATLGSLVYALPNRSNASGQPISTALYSRTTSIDFATRLAKILARRVGKPVYVGGEVRFWDQEDEACALKGCVDVVMGEVRLGTTT